MSACLNIPNFVFVSIDFMIFKIRFLMITWRVAVLGAWSRKNVIKRNGGTLSHYQSRRLSLRKRAYSNILKMSLSKTESFQIKIRIFFQISAQNIDCGYSLEPPR